MDHEQTADEESVGLRRVCSHPIVREYTLLDKPAVAPRDANSRSGGLLPVVAAAA